MGVPDIGENLSKREWKVSQRRFANVLDIWRTICCARWPDLGSLRETCAVKNVTKRHIASVSHRSASG